MASDAERAAMGRAVELAARGLGLTSPNPVVGAVVLDATGQVVGEGWHQRAGGPHAELVALDAAGPRARGGTVVVTLEPCSHTGRTPPCTETLLAAGVARLVIGVPDPVAAHGGGGAALAAAGVDVETGVEAAACARGNEAWLGFATRGRPFVTLKTATALDGRVAAADGTSRWITSAAARADAHLLRAQVDAVAVGITTVLADDPHLTVRDAAGGLAGRQPLRVVVDSQARTPTNARVLDGAAPTLLATTAAAPLDRLAALRETKADVVLLPAAADGHTDLPALLAELASRDVVHLLVEGGPTLSGSLVDLRLVDRVVSYVAPALLGGAGAAAIAGRGAATIEDAWRLRLDDVRRLGPDVRLTSRPETPERTA